MNIPLLDPSCDCGLLGAVRALTGIRNCIVLVHGRPGCHSGMLTLQALTSPQNLINVAYTGLRNEDLTYGGEQRLRKAILNVLEVANPELVVVCSCSAAGIMGDDVQGIVDEIKNRYGNNIDIIVIEAYGYKTKEQQIYEKTLLQLASLVKKTSTKLRNSINIIGFRTDMPYSIGDLEEIKRIVEANNIKINTVISYCSVRDIKNLLKAELNVVLGGDGILLAEYLHKEYNMPYIVVPYPYGIENTIKFIENICHSLGIEPNWKFIEQEVKLVQEKLSKFYTFVEGIYGSVSAAIVGEGSRITHLAKFLERELSFLVELVVARTSLAKKELLENVEMIEPDRYDLENRIRELEPDIIFGSSLERLFTIKYGIPLVRVFYPTIDEVVIFDRPIAGFRGVLTLVEKIVNELMRSQEMYELKQFATARELGSI